MSFKGFALRDSFVGSLAGWLVILLICGYPLSASFGLLFQLPTDTVNFASKAFFLVLALFILAIVLFKKKAQYFTWTGILILFFWIIYISRLGIDMFHYNVKDNYNSNLVVLSYAIGSCFIPSVALIFTGKFINLKKFVLNIWVILILINILLLSQILQNIDNYSIEVFQNRVAIKSESQKGDIINPILISLYGALLIIVSLSKLFFHNGNKIIKVILLWTAVILGFFAVLLGASRSPMLISLFIIFILVTIYLFKVFRINVKNISKLFFYIIAGFLIFGQVESRYSAKEFVLYERLISFKKDREKGYKEERDYERQAAIEDFLKSPIVGNHFINSYDKTYPHNIIFEAFMALGIIGGIIFLIVLFKSIHLIFLYSFSYPYYTSSLMFLFMTISLSFFSGSLWSNHGFWVSIAMLSSMKKSQFSYFLSNTPSEK